MYKQLEEALNIKPDNLINKLVQIPKANKKLTHTAYDKDAVHQADLLFLPEDRGFKYVLTVVDTASRYADAEPLKTKKSDEVVKAFKKIYKRQPLNKPELIKVDDGSEFKGTFNKYLKDERIGILRGKPNRHRSQALAEYINRVLGKVIMKKVNSNELNGINYFDWAEYLPKIMKIYNKYHKENDTLGKNRKEIENAEFDISELRTDLRVGDLVYIPREKPKNNEYGNFRSSDIRYYEKPYKIKDILMNPNSPIVYRVEGVPNAVYSRGEIIKADEKDKIKPDEEFYNVEKLTGKTKKNNRVFYRVKWEGYRKTTLEPRSELIKNPEIKKMIQEFDKK